MARRPTDLPTPALRTDTHPSHLGTGDAGHAGPIVCVENHATFRTLLRVLREQDDPQWLAVAWVQGRNTAPLESLPMLPFSVTRLDYLGDLDAAGLAIAASACAITESIGIPAGPAVRLWELLVNRKSRAARTPTNEQQADRLVQWLPPSVREKARTLLISGRVVPQEALRYDFLVETMGTGLADPKLATLHVKRPCRRASSGCLASRRVA